MQKGDYGYISHRKKVQLIKVIIGAALVITVLVTGIVTSGTRNNLLTVGSVLLVLPTANFLVNLIAMSCFKKPDDIEYEEFSKASEGKITSCDMIVTANQKLVPIQFSLIYKNGIVAYSNSKKINRRDAEANMNLLLKSIGCPVSIKILSEWKPFIRQVQSIETPQSEEETKELENIKYDLLKYSM